MTETRIKISSIVENQLPQFVKEEFPLVSEFLSQYYISLENQGGTSDILQNIDQYIKVDNLTNLIESTTLESNVTFFDSTINVTSTAGFPDSYGLLLIDSEIITYTSKSSTTFEGCVRGFNGITSYKDNDELTFIESLSEQHTIGTSVTNLSILFLKEFLNKVKKQVTPGFEDRELYSGLDERLFIKQSIDFYSSKGTDNSFKILFGALYGQNVEVIRPRDYLIQPSDAQYRITNDFVVESIDGNPEDLVNGTLYQDKGDFTDAAQGTITKVEKIRRNSKNYYVISLDSDYNKDIQPSGTIYGRFNIHPKTKIVSSIISGSTTLEVDSTVAFPNQNGNLLVNLENGTSLKITYTSKTLNQFLGCSGITQDIPESTEIKTDLYAYGYSNGKQVKIRILGVLSKLKIPEGTRFYSKDDAVKIKTLGINLKDYKSNNWFFNIPVKYEVKSIRLLDSSDKSYSIDLYDSHSLNVGNYVTLISSSGVEQSGSVTFFNNQKSFSIQLGSDQSLLDTNLTYTVKKNLSKVLTDNYPSVNQYTSNVQNVYYENDGSIYVSSPSLPTYLNYLKQPLKIDDQSITFPPDGRSGTFSGTTLDLEVAHGFYTGDSIVYKPLSETNNLGISTGVYFIKKISETQVKLARSRSNIFTENFVSVAGTVTSAKFELTDFTYRDLSTQLLESQKLIRKISNPEVDGKIYDTDPGITGIFINGVELLNYKSKDNIYYGPIEKIYPTAPGTDYDVISPPTLTIIDPIGSGANANCSVVGNLKRIDIIDPGFDYLEDPKIEILGGNGFNASAKPNLISFDHQVSFNSQSSAGLVKLNPINTIGFSSYHKFRDAEEVIYTIDGQNVVSGLSTNSSYFVSVQDAYTVKLHKSFSDAVSGINTIQLTSYGIGNHTFKSKNKKKKIGSITIENSGFNYQNKLTTASISGINTSSNVITILEHGYLSGEVITYNATQTPIGGLSSSTSYYVTKLDDNNFKLSSIGISTLGITTSFYYDTKQYVNLTSTGNGTHKFNYPEIQVSVKGKIGVSTLTGQDFNAIIRPIFRGEIKSVSIESGGSKYGSEEIINYNRQPLFELSSGSGIQLTPIVSDGQIVDVLINSPGNGYNSSPNIEIIGSGVGATLTPIFSNESLVEVKVISGGTGYDPNNTSIIVTSSGIGAKFESQIKSWKINLVERSIKSSKIWSDDGLLTSGLNSDYGLQYTHAYAPRSLRSLVQATTFREGERVYIPDLQLSDGNEITSNAHSPIIGWAYDGNPIYGPYGYSSKTGGAIKCLISGYKEKQNTTINIDRPSGYPIGFFIEDYEYTGDGDLDEHNGRFCITPEYPNGVYAYFSTISNGQPESNGLFEKYKKPIFPYIIGPTYRSKPITFNFDNYSNQDFIDINETGWRRNTTPYNLLNEKSSYDYLLNPNTIKTQNSIVKNISTGTIDSVGIITGGQNYQVGDKLVFKNKDKFISSAKARVSLVKGKPVSQITASTSPLEDVTLYQNGNEFIGFATIPHNYINNDLITFTGKYDYQKIGNISIDTNILSLTVGVGSTQYTGLVTYFKVAGNFNYPNIEINDIYQIGNEQVKILEIDSRSSRIKVLRNQNNTLGLVTYSAGIALTEKTKKFTINFGISTSYNFKPTKEFYFNPVESVGLGTTSGVGIVSTIYFSNPGVGITQLTIPTQSVYLPNHNLITGDSLIYSSNGGTVISVSTDGTSSFQLNNNSIVYVAKISNNLIGISTIKVGLGSTGTFVGVGSTSSGILYFNSIGTGNYHSFKTNYQNSLTGTINKNIVTVSTAETHGLSLFDSVIINVKPGINTTFVIKYDDYNRRMLINPISFSSINTENNTIVVNNHKYYTGQKVLYTSNTPATGLINESLYYAIVVDPNTIMLSHSYYGATKNDPEIINISSSTTGTISAINPPIEIVRNQTVTFDLSDISLSYFSNTGFTSYSAFEFKIYKDSKFIEEFDSTQSSSIFEISKIGQIGINSTAKLTLITNEKTPNNLYYKLIPVNSNQNSQIKKDIIIDDEVISANKISIVESDYNGKHTIIGISSNYFEFNVLEKPQFELLDANSSRLEYYTDASGVMGQIHEILVTDKGKGYNTLPGITSVLSDFGSNAVLLPITNSIGKVTSAEIQDIGFEYSADYSVRPTAKYPDILVLNSLSSFDYIGITSFGRNYNTPPTLVVIDGLTNKVISDVNLTYSFGELNVTIQKNTTELSNVTPKIIPTNNSNGIKIKNISFNNSSKDVTVTLGASFSDPEDFPFEIGSKVLVEGISVGVASTGRGYNSSNYDYSLFTITAVDPNIGGVNGIVTYSLLSNLNVNEIPGTFNSSNSSGKIIPESDFPIFNPVLKKNIFYEGETVYSSSANGIVENWDSDNRYLKVSSINDFEINQTIRGKTSGSVGIIEEIIKFESDYEIDSYSQIRKGWNRETGFLNNNFQRVHDSDYYQYFSYALKTSKDLNVWDGPVSALNHTVGFKKFGNLLIESKQSNTGITTDQNGGDFTGISDLSSFVSLNCVYDFDLASENNINIDGEIKSNEIRFNSSIIQDYIESVGNRVLMIDDISTQFNSNPRPTVFSIVDSFILEDFRSKKYITFVRDKGDYRKCELSLVSLVHNDSVGFLNQYGNISASDNLGFFDFNVFGTEGNLLYYPIKSKSNNYHVQLFSFSLNNISSGIGSLSLGDSVNLNTNTTNIPTATSSATNIVGIASTYRSAKVLVQIGATDSSYFEYDEITYIHNGTDVYFLDYGQLSTDVPTQISSSGIGTYNAYVSGSNVLIDLIPNESTTVDYVVNTFNVSLGNTIASGIGTEIIEGSSLSSSSIDIASSGSPTSNIIASYSNVDYDCSYSIISIEDKTNLEYQVCEFLTVSSDSTCYTTEFGIIQTNSSLGIITAGILGSTTNIYFTPIENIDTNVKVFKVDLGLSPDSAEISLTNGYLNYDYGSYTGTDNDIKKEFNLTHKNLPIFQRYFDASNPNVVKIDQNIITIQNNYYVTGEEIVYSSPGEGTTQSIGIATTSIPGIGTTDKLPSSLYVVKINDLDIKVASSATDALKTIPNVLDLTSIGIGNSHIFTSKNQNKKVIIGIDNLIQSPVTSTAVTTTLSKNITIFDSEVYVSGISSIYSGDLIKINSEIMKVSAVGVGSTNSISVIRPWLGTKISSHTLSNLVTKILGNYNIVDNILYFSAAPFGKVPFTNPSNRPDETDYVGIATGSSFSGRVFLRSGVSDTTNESYSNNYIFDDISNNFNGSQKSFTLKSNGTNVTGISTDNAIVLINSIFQGPVSSGFTAGDYDLVENAGITSITFTGSSQFTKYDVNAASVPRGGVILSVGSTQGFGYQPLVAAGGTAIVSSAGTIQSISIGNSGSGYRSGIQNIINVGIKTEDLVNSNIEFIGTAAVSNGSIVSIAITNPGIGYTTSNPPIVVFDYPLSYSNLPLVYSSQSSSGLGTGAYVDIVVGQGSSVISFEIKNLGYGYKPQEILTVSIGGTSGIQTNSSVSFSEFQIIIDQIQSDQFSAWSIGSLQVIDPLDSLFDGQRTRFPILIDGNQTTIRSKKGSNIDVQATLLVFINDVLQVPGRGYIFAGGSIIRFTEAPKAGDKSKILFYRGTGDVDTLTVDILETIKVGDTVDLNSDNILLKQDDRLVTDIVSTDVINTNLYSGPGISQEEDLLRPLTWCKQTEDLVVNGQSVGKDRVIYEPYIQPVSNIIQNVGIASTAIFVESVKTFFDSEKEYTHNGITEKPQNKISIVSQDNLIAAAATVVVSTSGTISSIIISDGGVGYTTSPIVSIQKPIDYIISTIGNIGINTNLITGINTSNIVVGYEIFEPSNIVSVGTTVTFIGTGTIGISTTTLNTESYENIQLKIGLGVTALALSTISVGGTVSSISISNAGTGYTTSNPPVVLIEPPQPNYEVIDNISYSGDFGVITGIKTTSVGVASTGIVFDFYIPQNSPLRDGKTVKVGIATTGISGIQTGYYFVVNKSNVGNGLTSQNSSGAVVGVGTTFIDNIYQVSAVSIAQTAVAGVGITYVAQVTVSVSGYNGLSGLGFSGFYGEYSWGRISVPTRKDPHQFTTYANIGGISSSPTIQRFNRLKYSNYNT
jgi:hypothetical protein